MADSLAATMDVQCFICKEEEVKCGSLVGRWIQLKGRQKLIEISQKRNDKLHETLDESCWVSDHCYKRYTKEQSVTVDVDNRILKKPRIREVSYGYKTHCLVCEKQLDFVAARKHPERGKLQISSIDHIDKKKKHCILQKTLTERCKGRSDPLSVEILSKLAYSSCLRASEAKYHRDCMQRFLSGVSIGGTLVSNRNLDDTKDKAFESFCYRFESGIYSGQMTLYDVQRHLEELSEEGDDIYSIKHLNRKLVNKYGYDLLRTGMPGRPIIIMMKEEADELLQETFEGGELPDDVEKEAKKLGSSIKSKVHSSEIKNEFYPSPPDITIEKLSEQIPQILILF